MVLPHTTDLVPHLDKSCVHRFALVFEVSEVETICPPRVSACACMRARMRVRVRMSAHVCVFARVSHYGSDRADKKRPTAPPKPKENWRTCQWTSHWMFLLKATYHTNDQKMPVSSSTRFSRNPYPKIFPTLTPLQPFDGVKGGEEKERFLLASFSPTLL